VTPRLSDTAASLTEEYTEMPGSFVKLQFEEGEVDFVAAPNLTDAAWERWEIQGRPVRVETAAEVIAKKMYHRGDRATARDLFDLSMVVEREPEALAAARHLLMRHRDRFLEQIKQPGRGSWRPLRRSQRPGTSRAWSTASRLPPPICPT
jgi:hypothetical protein